MAKTIIFIVLAVVFAVCAAIQFVGQLECASAGRARRDEDIERRSLELGIGGRIVFGVIFFAVMVLLAWASHIELLSTIAALIISVILVLLNTWFKGIDVNVFPALFLIWAGNTMGSLKNVVQLQGDVWLTIYVILQIVAFILLAVGTALGNLRRAYAGDTEDDEIEEDEEKDDKFERILTLVIKFLAIVIVVAVIVVIGFWVEGSFGFFDPMINFFKGV